MTQNLFFLRHAETEPILNSPAKFWRLSEEGEVQSDDLIDHQGFKDISIIYCSDEKKTLDTIIPFAIHYEIPVFGHSGLNEIHFSAGLPRSADLFLDLKKKCFADLRYSEGILESFHSGLSRFKDAITLVKQHHPNENVLVVSHGTILTLYFGSKLEILENGNTLFERWAKLRYCAWGHEKNGEILRDLM